MDVWTALTLEGNHTLIDKLRRAELKTPGFGTLVVPKAGFSPSDAVHNAVLTWCGSNQILLLNPSLEIARLQHALHLPQYIDD